MYGRAGALRPFEPTPRISPTQPFWSRAIRRPSASGAIDSISVDGSRYAWRSSGVAMDEAGCVLRLDPDGCTILSLPVPVPVPVRCPTRVAFGGLSLRTLCVTTSRRRRPAQELGEHPLSGAVFFTEVEPAGLPEARYRG